MPTFDLFSKRRKRAAGEMPDVYTYEIIPEELRVQIVHIWGDAIGRNNHEKYLRCIPKHRRDTSPRVRRLRFGR